MASDITATRAAPTHPANISRINWLEQAIADSGVETLDLPLSHKFTTNLYSREIFLPADALVTSKIHKTQHQFVLLQGKASVWTNDGDEVVISAPYVGVTEAGTRRVVYAHEDCRWITFHPTKTTDLEALEKELIEPHYIPKMLGSGNKQLESEVSE